MILIKLICLNRKIIKFKKKDKADFQLLKVKMKMKFKIKIFVKTTPFLKKQKI